MGQRRMDERMSIVFASKFRQKAEEKNYCETWSDTIRFYYRNNKLLAPWHEWLWGGHAHVVDFPAFSDSIWLSRFYSQFSLSSTWCYKRTGKTLMKISHLRSEFSSHFPARSRLTEPPHCLCDTLVYYRSDFHSLNINLRVVSCSQFFFLSGSGRAVKKWWKFMCSKIQNSSFSCRGIEVSEEFRVGGKFFTICVFWVVFPCKSDSSIASIVRWCFNWHTERKKKKKCTRGVRKKKRKIVKNSIIIARTKLM